MGYRGPKAQKKKAQSASEGIAGREISCWACLVEKDVCLQKSAVGKTWAVPSKRTRGSRFRDVTATYYDKKKKERQKNRPGKKT